MISMHNVASAGGAVHYFSQDNYYTQEEGLQHSAWFGQGAQQLGLSGQIAPAAFFDLLQGRVDGQELGKWVTNEKTGAKERDHRPGTDLTFSAPKSVSILAEVFGRTDVRDAHEAAVNKALTYIEQTLAMARQTEGGKTEAVLTGNLVIGLFRHDTSRDLDPQTHTHAVTLNATQRADGQWRSLSNDELYKAQRVIGAIYNAELADRLQASGYTLERTDAKGNFEIAGISREQIEHFSQRRTQIETALHAKGIAIQEATAAQKEWATLQTRANKVDVDHAALTAEWQMRAKDVGIDLEKILAQVDTLRLQGGVVRADRLTGKDAMAFAAAHLIEREVVVPKETLLAVAMEHGAGRVAPGEIQAAFEKLEQSGDLIALADGQYTTRKMLGSEQWALEHVRAEKGKTPTIMVQSEVEGEVEAKIKAEERQQGFKFTIGQREALTTALTSSDRYVGVQGLAGTGKTTMLKTLRILAQEQGVTVRGMAPTGAAAKVLANEAGIASDTVAMFQIKERQLQKDIAFARQYAPDFVRKPELWIVDESSLLGQRQKAQLDHLAQAAGAKVVYLGDSLQLQGVEAGKPFELAQKGGMQTAYMTEISRQKTSDMKAAVDIMTGRDRLGPEDRLTNVVLNNNARAFAFMDQAGMVREVSSDALIDAVVKDIVSLGREERAQTIVLTAYNEDRQAINAGVRDGLKAVGELVREETMHEIFLSKGWTRAMVKEAQYYQSGDVVRFGRDYQKIDAGNGEVMRVASVNPVEGRVFLQKDDGRLIEWEPQKYNKVEIYDVESRALAKGDLIRMTRNEGDFKNGEIAMVSGINSSQVTLESKQGKSITTNIVDLARSKHWDHAYASTVHAAQGATQKRAILHIRAPEKGNELQQASALKNMAKVFGDRSFYVGVTRASHELRIYTNNKEAAARAVEARQDKTSAVETTRRNEGLNKSHISDIYR
jgi:conjugative relaxase-like TrwC/TraI family protein